MTGASRSLMGEGLSLCPGLGSHSSPMSLPALMAQSCPSSWRTGTHVASHTARPAVHFQGRLVLGGLVPSLPRLVASLVTQLLLLRPGSRPSEQGSVTLFAGTQGGIRPSRALGEAASSWMSSQDRVGRLGADPGGRLSPDHWA